MRRPCRLVSSLRVVLALAVLALGGAPRAASAQGALAPVALVQTTRSVQDWPLQVAQSLGFFARNGIALQLTVVGSSASVAQQLAAGSADIGTVSTTQVVEAIEGGAPIVQILKNVVTSPYTIVGRKGVTSIAQLRGKTIMIGGPNDITRVFMDRVLFAHGLRPEDCTYTYAGAPAVRYAALLSGAIDATLVLPPVNFQAAAAGYPVLDDTQRYFPRFPTSGYTARTEWARTHPELATAFVKSFLEGVRWLYDPRNENRALQILEENTNVSPTEARQTYALYTKDRLFSLDGRYDANDFPQVLDVLVRTKQIPAPAPAPGRFYDDRYADAALTELGRREGRAR